MIKININNIKEWEFIKRCHEEYFRTHVLSEKCGLTYSNSEYSNDLKTFIDSLFKEDKELSTLATGEIGSLKEYAKQYDYFIGGALGKWKDEKYKEAKKELDRLLKILFNYEKFRGRVNNIIIDGKKISWNRHRLVSLMGIKTCPYCNRQYITNFEDSKTTADLDHFFTQNEYPLLALSLYNFIPSCQICNSRFKGQTFDAGKHIYPYDEEFGDECKFQIESSSLDYLWNEGVNDFNIELVNISKTNKEKIDNSILTFKLREVYQSHKDYVTEIIQKSMIYNEDVIEDILVQYPDMFSNSQEVWQCVMGNYMQDSNLNNRPLAKLTRDIAREYGINL